MNAKNYTIENWKLTNVDATDWIADRSGVYVLIYWQVKTNTIRLDIMSDNHIPIMSFAGSADAVRKHAMRFMSDNIENVSLEHAAYIGSEIEKADFLRIDYIQDQVKTDQDIMRKFENENKTKAEEIIRKYD